MKRERLGVEEEAIGASDDLSSMCCWAVMSPEHGSDLVVLGYQPECLPESVGSERQIR